jgi:hypothetical protein
MLGYRVTRTFPVRRDAEMKKMTLVYGIRLINEEQDGHVAAVEHGQVLLERGQTRQVTMHTIEGSVEQIKSQLLESIDAFFELLP